MPFDARCPGCGAPRIPSASCPQCGTSYAPDAPAARPAMVEEADALEHKLRIYAPPIVLVLAFLAYSTSMGRSLFRVFLSMWLHELGHAVTAWLAGFVSFPGPWRTPIAEHRSVIFSLFVLAVLIAGTVAAWQTRRRVLAALLAAAILIKIILTLFVSEARAHELIYFMGDGGGLVIGTLLFATFWSAPGSRLHTTWLRWGFLVIGAFGFMDPFLQWWRARHDYESIPFGEIEGVGDSDPSQLTDGYGWSIHALVARYVTLGVCCLIAMAVVYALGLRRRRATS